MMTLCCEVLSALRGKTLATAESCTGGGIGAALTAVPGASEVYKGGIISYTNSVKEHLLGVDGKLLEQIGAVSAPVAQAMAIGARAALEADVAVSVTGLAGPGGDEFGNPVGTVFIGYCDERTSFARRFHWDGDRETVRREAVRRALEIVLEQNRQEKNCMEKIASFTVDHIRLLPGLYVSRVDSAGQEKVTTFDLRLTAPNREPVMNTAEVHTIEHLGATYLRNEPVWGSRVLYFGPMGCRTGFYLLLAGEYSSRDVLPLVTDCFRFIRDYRGEVPGASPRDCGNYLDMNLNMANYWGGRYLAVLEHITPERLSYPE